MSRPPKQKPIWVEVTFIPKDLDVKKEETLRFQGHLFVRREVLEGKKNNDVLFY